MHFRQEHFLCEDEACLAKKFIVFPTESEMKVLSGTLCMMSCASSFYEAHFQFFSFILLECPT